MKAFLIPICTTLLLASAAAQSDSRLYDGAKSVRSQKITLRAWGSGGIAETNEVAFQGAQSVRVSSRNYFQGGTLTFNEVKDLGEEYDEKSSLLRVTFFLADAGTVYGVDAKNKDKNQMGGIQATQHAVAFTSGKKGDLTVSPAIPFKPKIKKVRVIVSTSDGKKSEIYVPVYSSTSAGSGWRSLAIPLQSITGLDRTNKNISSLTLSADTVAVLYVGDVRVVSDTTPINGEIESVPLNVKWGSQVTLKGRGDAGNTPLVYSWDFDDRDGIQVDADGPQVKAAFRKKGEFNVTLTISDYYGVKKPVQKTLKVKVAG